MHCGNHNVLLLGWCSIIIKINERFYHIRVIIIIVFKATFHFIFLVFVFVVIQKKMSWVGKIKINNWKRKTWNIFVKNDRRNYLTKVTTEQWNDLIKSHIPIKISEKCGWNRKRNTNRSLDSELKWCERIWEAILWRWMAQRDAKSDEKNTHTHTWRSRAI